MSETLTQNTTYTSTKTIPYDGLLRGTGLYYDFTDNGSLFWYSFFGWTYTLIANNQDIDDSHRGFFMATQNLQTPVSTPAGDDEITVKSF
jgi:hypothetical protein